MEKSDNSFQEKKVKAQKPSPFSAADKWCCDATIQLFKILPKKITSFCLVLLRFFCLFYVFRTILYSKNSKHPLEWKKVLSNKKVDKPEEEVHFGEYILIIIHSFGSKLTNNKTKKNNMFPR